MNKLKVENFKAFEEAAILPLENRKNLLLYGENGAGKSSIYQAVKIAFFRDKLERSITALTPEDRAQLIKNFWEDFNNKINNQNFTVEVDDIDYKTFSSASYQVFMVSIDELGNNNDSINLNTLLNRFFFDIPNIDDFCLQQFSQIQDKVNQTLALFLEKTTIEIDEQDQYNVKLISLEKNIERKNELKKYFNEAKLNVIILLILLSAVEIAKDSDKQKILVLDDFITSLDVSNRTFIIKYIFDNFIDTQILVLTHNISFYNLIMYMINEIYSCSDNWVFANLYEINNSHKLYIKTEIEKVKDLKTAFATLTNASTSVEIETLGNRVRKKFEILLYEYSKLMMIGTVEESKNILHHIVSGKTAYYNVGKTATDLVESIIKILDQNITNNLDGRIRAKIADFTNADLYNFQRILTDLKLYQKVTMHPMSHGTVGMSNFTLRELKKSIELLEKMEDYLKGMVGANIVAI